MSEWKEDAKQRRDARQSIPDKQVASNKKKKKKAYKPWRVICTFSRSSIMHRTREVERFENKLDAEAYISKNPYGSCAIKYEIVYKPTKSKV